MARLSGWIFRPSTMTVHLFSVPVFPVRSLPLLGSHFTDLSCSPYLHVQLILFSLAKRFSGCLASPLSGPPWLGCCSALRGSYAQPHRQAISIFNHTSSSRFLSHFDAASLFGRLAGGSDFSQFLDWLVSHILKFPSEFATLFCPE